MFEDNRWRRMLKPGITAIVGAGGKTTVLERLGTYGHGGHLPIMVSSIVPMDSTRVDNVEPFDVICTEDMEKANHSALNALLPVTSRPGSPGSTTRTAISGSSPRSSMTSRCAILPGISLSKAMQPAISGLKRPWPTTCPCRLPAILSSVF